MTSRAFSVIGGEKDGLDSIGDCSDKSKETVGFTKLLPSIITIAGMVISFYFLSSAIKTLPMGTAYAIWTGNRGS
jgi:quaternary ammonium compound-resistance protein SugE